MLRFLTAGESHGKGITSIIEGIPAGLPVTEELIAATATAYVEKLVALGRSPDARRHAAELIRANAPRLYRDRSFITAFDSFLKNQCRGG